MSRNHRIAAFAATFALALVLVLPSTAHAQQSAQGGQGFMIGFGLGFSLATCDDCDDFETGLAFDLNIGGFLNPRLALMYDVAAWIDSEDGATLTLASNTLAAQYWVAPAFWLKGGIGLSQARFSFNGNSDSEFGLGVTAAAGYEVMQRNNFALDLSGRLNILDFEGFTFETFNVVIGARWK